MEILNRPTNAPNLKILIGPLDTSNNSEPTYRHNKAQEPNRTSGQIKDEMLNRTLWTPQQMLIRPLDTKKKNERLKCPEVGLGCWISHSPRGREPSEPQNTARCQRQPQTVPSVRDTNDNHPISGHLKAEDLNEPTNKSKSKTCSEPPQSRNSNRTSGHFKMETLNGHLDTNFL